MNRLTGAQWVLLMRASAALAGASAAVAFFPFKTALAFGRVDLRGTADRLPIKDVVWAVEAAARRMPWRTMCIEQGLAAQRLLRSAGHDAVLHYGARHSADSQKLEAHVWVSVDSEIVVGGEEASHFQEIASFR